VTTEDHLDYIVAQIRRFYAAHVADVAGLVFEGSGSRIRER